MQTKPQRQKLVLALGPVTKGFGFAIFEGPRTPIDWGLRATRTNKNSERLGKIAEIIDFYDPDAIVIEDKIDSRRHKRISELLEKVSQLARQRGIRVAQYARSTVRDTFAQFGAATKFEIANAITSWLPEFEATLPPFRKPWMSEDYRMGVFDAISLILTFYYLET